MFCSNCGKKLKTNIYTCSKCGFENVSPLKYSNKISLGKYIFYNIVSFGIYEVVWIYRTWKYIKEKENLDISPFWRTVFIIFYLRKMLNKIKEYSEENNIPVNFSPTSRTIFWIITSLGENSYNNRYSESFPFAIAFIFLLKPVETLNSYYEKTEINTTERPTEWWHIALIVLCILGWIGLLSDFLK